MCLGYPPCINSLSLKTSGENDCNIELDKTVRGKIHYAGLATDVIEYSANDVKYLETIMNKQKEELAKKGIEVDRKIITMHDIKKVGEYEALVHFHKEVEVKVPVVVVAENQPAPKAEEVAEAPKAEEVEAEVSATEEEAPAAE
mgnify:CR=1 FL=1